jgi:hypothetical protein
MKPACIAKAPRGFPAKERLLDKRRTSRTGERIFNRPSQGQVEGFGSLAGGAEHSPGEVDPIFGHPGDCLAPTRLHTS